MKTPTQLQDDIDRIALRFFIRCIVCTVLFAVIVLLCQQPTILRAATIRKVYTGGTSGGGDQTYTLSQLQNAIDDAAANDACGSEILLEQNANFSSPSTGFILKQLVATPTWDCITIRTGVDSAGTVLSTGLFPAVGVRINTSYRSVLAKLTPTTNNEASIRTVFPSEVVGCTPTCVGSGWTLKWLEFDPKVDWAQRALIRFGTNKDMIDLPSTNGQDTLVEIPQYLTLIQCDVHGDSFIGQHQGILISTKDARVLHNSFTDFKSLAETQAITIVNSVGPLDIENNLVEGSGENLMAGGSDSYLQAQATVTGTPTTTSFQMTSPLWVHHDGSTEAANLATDIFSGIFVSITHAAIDYGNIVCTFSGSTCTVPTLPFTPSVGDTVRWTWITGGITIKNNYFLKPLSWMNPILPTLSGITAKAGSSGTLAASTYCYVVVSRAFVSGSPTPATPSITSGASAEACTTTSGATGSVTVSWPADTNAGEYRVYGRIAGSQAEYYTVTTGSCCSFTDTGTAGTAGTPPVSGTIWTVKNTFELKHCDGGAPAGPCVIEGNVIENSWCCSQSNIVSIKVNNQNAKDVSATVRNLSFRYNWIKHANRGIALTCTTTGNTSPQAPSGVMTDVTISNNLFTDLSSAWINTSGTKNNSAILVTSGSYANEIGSRGCLRLTISHNSFFVTTNDMNGPAWLLINTASDKLTDFVVKNNIMARDCTTTGTNGCVSLATRALKGFNPNNAGQGTSGWSAVVQGTSTIDYNVWPDGVNTIYTDPTFPTATTFFPTDATLKSTHLADYTNCANDTNILGCKLLVTSNLALAASDGMDLGADIVTLKTQTDIALSGSVIVTLPPSPFHSLRLRLRIGGDN